MREVKVGGCGGDVGSEERVGEGKGERGGKGVRWER